MRKVDYQVNEKEIFQHIYSQLRLLGIPDKYGAYLDGNFKNIHTILATQACFVGREQVRRYVTGKVDPKVHQWDDIFSKLCENQKLNKCPQPYKNELLTLAGQNKHKNPSFTLEGCYKCRMCAYPKSCRENTKLYSHCVYAQHLCKINDEIVNFYLHFNTPIGDIHNRKIRISDIFVEWVDTIYETLGNKNVHYSLQVNRKYLELIFGHISLLMQIDKSLWVLALLDEERVMNLKDYCKDLKSTKNVFKMREDHSLSESLLQFIPKLQNLSEDLEEVEVSDIVTWEGFQKLNLLELVFASLNLPILTYCRFRPIDLEVISMLIEYFTIEEIREILQTVLPKLPQDT